MRNFNALVPAFRDEISLSLEKIDPAGDDAPAQKGDP